LLIEKQLTMNKHFINSLSQIPHKVYLSVWITLSSFWVLHKIAGDAAKIG
jgi:hypothetical protein